jgi:hypothetical protein
VEAFGSMEKIEWYKVSLTVIQFGEEEKPEYAVP